MTPRLAVALTILNLALLGCTLGSGRSTAQAGDGTLRGTALELTDDAGRVRSRIDVESGGTVVFRLMDQEGTIRVKLGADTGGSGLVLLDETTEPGVHLLARRTATADRPDTTGITLRSGERQRVLTACLETKRCDRS